MIRYTTFPPSWSAPPWAEQIIDVFRRHEADIGSESPAARRSSEAMLAVLADDLQRLGFRIEKLNLSDNAAPRRQPEAPGTSAQRYHVDVYHSEWHCCIAIKDGIDWSAVEGDGQGVEPLLVANADTLCLAVPGARRSGTSAADPVQPGESDYERALALAQVVYAHSRAYLPRRLLLIGY